MGAADEVSVDATGISYVRTGKKEQRSTLKAFLDEKNVFIQLPTGFGYGFDYVI